ncbi:MAG: CoA-disulfide reductase [Bacillus sp. (in: Bacteria)]|nr:CoA-disulfide reductase [Bacillus sp. (in: firmicutes)]
MDHVVIVGGVAAGMSAASKIRRMNRDVKISVYEKGDFISYGACGLPYYVSGVTPSYEQLIIRTKDQFKEQGIDVFLKHEVIRLFPSDNTILVRDMTNEDYEIVSFDKLLIATGSRPVAPPFMNQDLTNVFTLKDIPDGSRIREAALQDEIKEVTIVGAGYIGLELVEAMLHLNKKVRIIENQVQILPMFDKELAELLETDLKKLRVEIIKNESVIELQHHFGKVTGVKTDKGTYSAQMVIVNVGVRPNTEFLNNTDIKLCKKGAIIVNEFQETSIPNIFSAGDCTASYHLVLAKLTYLPLGTVANKHGRVAGENMAGGSKKFPGVLGTSVVKINDLTLAKTGISEKEAIENELDYKTVFVETKSHASYYPDPKPIYIKLVYESDTLRLLGAQMLGEEGVAKRIDVLATAIYNRMSTEEIGFLDLSYAPPFASVWDAVQIAANAAK